MKQKKSLFLITFCSLIVLSMMLVCIIDKPSTSKAEGNSITENLNTVFDINNFKSIEINSGEISLSNGSIEGFNDSGLYYTEVVNNNEDTTSDDGFILKTNDETLTIGTGLACYIPFKVNYDPNFWGDYISKANINLSLEFYEIYDNAYEVMKDNPLFEVYYELVKYKCSNCSDLMFDASKTNDMLNVSSDNKLISNWFGYKGSKEDGTDKRLTHEIGEIVNPGENKTLTLGEYGLMVFIPTGLPAKHFGVRINSSLTYNKNDVGYFMVSDGEKGYADLNQALAKSKKEDFTILNEMVLKNVELDNDGRDIVIHTEEDNYSSKWLTLDSLSLKGEGSFKFVDFIIETNEINISDTDKVTFENCSIEGESLSSIVSVSNAKLELNNTKIKNNSSQLGSSAVYLNKCPEFILDGTNSLCSGFNGIVGVDSSLYLNSGSLGHNSTSNLADDVSVTNCYIDLIDTDLDCINLNNFSNDLFIENIVSSKVYVTIDYNSSYDNIFHAVSEELIYKCDICLSDHKSESLYFVDDYQVANEVDYKEGKAYSCSLAFKNINWTLDSIDCPFEFEIDSLKQCTNSVIKFKVKNGYSGKFSIYNNSNVIFSGDTETCTEFVINGKNLHSVSNMKISVNCELEQYPINYHIEYDENTYDILNSNPSFYDISSAIDLEDLSCTGIVFGGWYTDPEFINSLSVLNPGALKHGSSIDLYAKLGFDSLFDFENLDTLASLKTSYVVPSDEEEVAFYHRFSNDTVGTVPSTLVDENTGLTMGFDVSRADGIYVPKIEAGWGLVVCRYEEIKFTAPTGYIITKVQLNYSDKPGRLFNNWAAGRDFSYNSFKKINAHLDRPEVNGDEETLFVDDDYVTSLCIRNGYDTTSTRISYVNVYLKKAYTFSNSGIRYGLDDLDFGDIYNDLLSEYEGSQINFGIAVNKGSEFDYSNSIKKDFVIDSDGIGDKSFAMVINNIPDFSQLISACAYVCIDGTYYYAKPSTYSINSLANKYVTSYSTETEVAEILDILKALVYANISK